MTHHRLFRLATALAALVLLSALPAAAQTSFGPRSKTAPDTDAGTASRTGGPDTFGYTFVDSDEPSGPTYSWIDISASGTAVTLTDDGETTLTLPFAFPFYGQTATTARLGSNGALIIGATTGNIPPGNGTIPSQGAPNNIVAPFWDDLNPGAGGQIRTQDMGDGRFVVSWLGVPRFGDSASVMTFQVILDQSGEITYQYNTMTGTTNSATIGIENADGTDGLQVARNAPYARNGLAVRFSVAPTGFGPRADFATGLSGPEDVAELTDGTILVTERSTGTVFAYPAAGGTATTFASGLSQPIGVTQLDGGTVLVTEFTAGRVAAFTSNGTPLPDFATGLSSPVSVVQLANTGTVLVAERGANRIAAFTPSGAPLPVFATTGSGLRNITQLPDGRVLAAEQGENRVSAYPATGGTGTVFVGSFGNPTAVTGLADGRVLVASFADDNVVIFTSSGASGGTLASATGPVSVMQLSDGRVLVVENGANRVSVFTPVGLPPPPPPPVPTQVFGPLANFATGLSSASIVTQLADGRVLIVDGNIGGGVFTMPAGGGPRTTFTTALTNPADAVQLANGDVLIAAGGRVARFQSDGTPLPDFATGLATAIGLTRLADGRVLVVEQGLSRISEFPATGGARTTFASGFSLPYDVIQLSNGNVLVSEAGNDRISVFAPVAGSTTFGPRADFATGLNGPLGLTQLADGRVLVAEQLPNRVSVLPATGGTRADFLPGFGTPVDVTQLSDGRVLVASSFGGRVVQLPLEGTSSNFTEPVAVTEARLFNPSAAESDGAGYRLLGAPVTGLRVTDLAGLNLVQGVFGDSDEGTLPEYPLAGANLFTTFDGTAYVGASSTAEALPPGRGFFWYLYDQDIPADPAGPFGGGTSSSSELTDFALAGFGPQAEADVTLSVADNAGANDAQMLANPFARPFAVSGISATGGTFQGGSVQVYDPAGGGSFAVRSGTDRLAPWQGFFAELVPTTAGDPVVVTYAFASTDDAVPPVFVGRSDSTDASVRPNVRFTLEGTLESGAAVRDEAAVVRFDADADAGWDALDASKITPPNAARALIAPTAPRDGVAYRLAVDTRPDGAEARVPLSLSATEAGTFRLSWTAELPDGWTATITDTETGETTDLRRASETAFATTAAQDWAERFRLDVQPRGAVSSEGGASAEFALAAPYPNPARGAAQIPFSLAQASTARLTVFDLLGREVAVLVDGDRAAGAHTEALDAGRLAPGVYVVRLSAGTEMQTQRLVVVR